MSSLRNIRVLSWFYTLYNFRFFSVISILYFSQITGSYTLGLSVFSVAQLSQAVFEVPAGIISDRWGRAICLQLGSLASLLAITMYAVGFSYWILLIGALFEGLNRALFSGNNDALLYETLEAHNMKGRYQEVMGKTYSNLELAGFVSAIFGGVLAAHSFGLVFWLSVIPQILGFGLSWLFVEPKQLRETKDSILMHLRRAFSLYGSNFKVRNISLASILGFGVGESSWSFQAVFYNTLLPVWAVGWAMSLNFLASTISYRLSGKLFKRFAELKVLVFQEVISRSLYILALAFPTIASPFIMASASITYGSGEVAKNTLLQHEFNDAQRATMASINSLLGNCFFATFAIGLGSVADAVGPAKALLFAQFCLLPVGMLYFVTFRRSRGSVNI